MNNTAHHEKLDELIENARESMHQMLDQAIVSGALTEDQIKADNYLLSKMIITIWGDKREHLPLTNVARKEMKNLSHFI